MRSRAHRSRPPLTALALAALLTGCAPEGSPPHLAGGIDSVLFVRSGCYEDDCPAYRILLRRDGTADWVGADLAVPAGEAHGHVAPIAWRSLTRAVIAVGLDTLDDVYPSPELESSRAEIRVFASPWPPRVVATQGGSGPPALEGLFARVDSVAGELGWHGVNPFRPTVGGIRPF